MTPSRSDCRKSSMRGWSPTSYWSDPAAGWLLARSRGDLSRASARSQRVMVDRPLPVLRAHEDVRLLRFAVFGALGRPDETFGRLQLGEPVADLAAIGLDGVGLREHLLALEDALQDEHVLPGGHAVEIGIALEPRGRLGRGECLGVHRCEAGRDDHPLGLLRAALERLEARGAREADEHLGLHALALHLLQHTAGG